MFKSINNILLVVGVITIAVVSFLSYSIQREQHLLSLYSTYRGNIDSCTALATQQGKDEQFIKDNCVKEINSSLIGISLKKWGKPELLVSEK